MNNMEFYSFRIGGIILELLFPYILETIKIKRNKFEYREREREHLQKYEPPYAPTFCVPLDI